MNESMPAYSNTWIDHQIRTFMCFNFINETTFTVLGLEFFKVPWELMNQYIPKFAILYNLL